MKIAIPQQDPCTAPISYACYQLLSLAAVCMNLYRATYTGTGGYNLCLSIRKLVSVVKDVDLEAMPTSIFLNDDDDESVKQCV